MLLMIFTILGLCLYIYWVYFLRYIAKIGSLEIDFVVVDVILLLVILMVEIACEKSVKIIMSKIETIQMTFKMIGIEYYIYIHSG